MTSTTQTREAIIALSPVQSTVQVTKELNLAGYNKIDRVDFQEALLEQVESARPQIVIVSSELPGRKQVTEVLSKIKEISPSTKVIFITKSLEQDNILELFLATNLHGMLLSERAERTLSLAIEAAEANQLFMDISAARLLKEMISDKQALLANHGSDYGYLELLTEREAEVLKYLTEGLNYKSIANTLFISESTVKTHINNIFTKLQVNDRTQAVLYALRHDLESLMRETMAVQR